MKLRAVSDLQKALILITCLLFLNTACASNSNWRTASRESMGIAADPKIVKEPIVQVYSARTFGWRKHFAVHTWIATKAENADHYLTYHVTSWGGRSTGRSIVIKKDLPDRRWYGADATMIAELRGVRAGEAILKIEAAAKEYRYQNFYRMVPGPNSNSFVSYLLRNAPEIGVELPPNAIGRDWLEGGALFGVSESGTGFQFSILGVLGFTLGLADGIEINLLTMTFGLDLWRPALKLPFIGRVGFDDDPVSF
jgi:hypothetical protein